MGTMERNMTGDVFSNLTNLGATPTQHRRPVPHSVAQPHNASPTPSLTIDRSAVARTWFSSLVGEITAVPAAPRVHVNSNRGGIIKLRSRRSGYPGDSAFLGFSFHQRDSRLVSACVFGKSCRMIHCGHRWFIYHIFRRVRMGIGTWPLDMLPTGRLCST